MFHTIFKQPNNLQRRSSVHIEEVNDQDLYPRNVASLNKSRILELSDKSEDGNDDMDCPPLETVDDEEDSNDDKDKEVIEEPEESAEAELGEYMKSQIDEVLIELLHR